MYIHIHTYCLLPTAYCHLPIAYCLLPVAYCLFAGFEIISDGQDSFEHVHWEELVQYDPPWGRSHSEKNIVEVLLQLRKQ